METSSLIEAVPLGDAGGFRSHFGSREEPTCTAAEAVEMIQAAIRDQQSVSPLPHREAA